MVQLLVGIFAVVDYLLGIYIFLLFISVILKMVRADSSNPLVRGIYVLSDPPCRWLLRKFPKLYVVSNDGAAMDLSPTALMIGLGCIKVFLPYLRDFLINL